MALNFEKSIKMLRGKLTISNVVVCMSIENNKYILILNNIDTVLYDSSKTLTF